MRINLSNVKNDKPVLATKEYCYKNGINVFLEKMQMFIGIIGSLRWSVDQKAPECKPKLFSSGVHYCKCGTENAYYTVIRKNLTDTTSQGVHCCPHNNSSSILRRCLSYYSYGGKTTRLENCRPPKMPNRKIQKVHTAAEATWGEKKLRIYIRKNEAQNFNVYVRLN